MTAENTEIGIPKNKAHAIPTLHGSRSLRVSRKTDHTIKLSAAKTMKTKIPNDITL